MKKKKKKAVKKKAAKKKVAKKPKKKKVVKKAKKKAPKAKKKSLLDSLSKGASLEEVGEVTHYFPKVTAAVVKLTKGSLSVGDTIIIKGHTTEFKEKVNSIQLEHVVIATASKGQEIGLKVKAKVRERDVVYKLIR